MERRSGFAFCQLPENRRREKEIKVPSMTDISQQFGKNTLEALHTSQRTLNFWEKTFAGEKIPGNTNTAIISWNVMAQQT